jgi:AhpC/TSA antioxidant enzyme
LREHESEFQKLGAKLAAIGLGDRNYAKLFREETGIAFPLLIDEERLAYRAAGLRSGNLLHILRRDNTRARARAKAGGYEQHRLGPNPFQLGASFIFAPGNVDVYKHVSKTFGDNASLDDLLAALPPPPAIMAK